MNTDNQSYGSNSQENEFLLYLGIILRRKWIILTALIMSVTMAAISSFKAENVYKATTQLLIEKENSSSMYREGVAVDISGLDYYQTQYRIIKSRTIAKKVIEELNLSQEPEFKTVKSGDPVDVFLKHVIVEPIRGSRLVNLSVESHSPELATKIANTLADVYVTQNLENRLFASREILKKMPNQFSVQTVSDKDVMESLPSVVGSQMIQDLKTELIKYEADYANLSGRYKSKHPTMLTLQAKINLLSGRINSEMKNTMESVRTELSGEFKANNVRIVDYAEIPTNPVSPKKKRNIFLACIFGLTIGTLGAFFFEYIDNTIKSSNDIEQHIGVPFLGMVPVIKEKTNRSFITESTDTPFVETIKTIRTNLMFSAPEDKLKAILVTSCSPGEGKTFVSMNIASSFCQAGKRTLLIDADLRRNALTKAMKKDNLEGLSNYLIGDNTFDSVIQNTEIKNLCFISSGTHTPDPAELLGSKKMKELIEKAKTVFDRIIIDSAPVLPVSDTLNISSIMDGTVQVVAFGKSTRNMVNLGKRKLQSVGAKITGIIINYVNIKSHSSYYGYGYYAYKEYGKYY